MSAAPPPSTAESRKRNEQGGVAVVVAVSDIEVVLGEDVAASFTFSSCKR